MIDLSVVIELSLVIDGTGEHYLDGDLTMNWSFEKKLGLFPKCFKILVVHLYR